MWIRDTSGQPSITATAFVVGFVVATLKLMVSGVTVSSVSLGTFGGGEYATALAALGAIYILRRNTSNTAGNRDE